MWVVLMRRRLGKKEKSLSLSDLDDIWAAQDGKHEAIVKNVHDLLAKLAGWRSRYSGCAAPSVSSWST